MLKKIMALSAAALLGLAGLTGCTAGEVGANSSVPGTDTGKSGSGDTSTAAKLTGSLVMAGSTSIEKVCGALGEAFGDKHPELTIDLQATGSGAAITALNDGTAQIGNLSRAVKDSENPDGKYEAITIALDGIAIIVHKNNAAADLTAEQLASIFKKEVTNWKDVGGPDKAITVIGRETGSGTRDGFEEVVKVKDACQYDATLDSTGAVVARVASDEGAIGYVSFASVGDGVKALKVGGVTPSESTIADKTYVIQRPFVQAYIKDTKDVRVQAYIEFLKTDEAQKLIRDADLVPQKFW